ncbi:hypothetical protein ACHAWF_010936 [Thalassiosira exigua]
MTTTKRAQRPKLAVAAAATAAAAALLLLASSASVASSSSSSASAAAVRDAPPEPSERRRRTFLHAILPEAAPSSSSSSSSSAAALFPREDDSSEPGIRSRDRRSRRRRIQEAGEASASEGGTPASLASQSSAPERSDYFSHPRARPCPGHEESGVQGYSSLSDLQADLDEYYASFLTLAPTGSPTVTAVPTPGTWSPTTRPTKPPTPSPTDRPTLSPTESPSNLPTKSPITFRPTPFPTSQVRIPASATISPAPSIVMFVVGFADADGDGIPDALPDLDGDGIPDELPPGVIGGAGGGGGSTAGPPPSPGTGGPPAPGTGGGPTSTEEEEFADMMGADGAPPGGFAPGAGVGMGGGGFDLDEDDQGGGTGGMRRLGGKLFAAEAENFEKDAGRLAADAENIDETDAGRGFEGRGRRGGALAAFLAERYAADAGADTRGAGGKDAFAGGNAENHKMDAGQVQSSRVRQTGWQVSRQQGNRDAGGSNPKLLAADAGRKGELHRPRKSARHLQGMVPGTGMAADASDSVTMTEANGMVDEVGAAAAAAIGPAGEGDDLAEGNRSTVADADLVMTTQVTNGNGSTEAQIGPPAPSPEAASTLSLAEPPLSSPESLARSVWNDAARGQTFFYQGEERTCAWQDDQPCVTHPDDLGGTEAHSACEIATIAAFADPRLTPEVEARLRLDVAAGARGGGGATIVEEECESLVSASEEMYPDVPAVTAAREGYLARQTATQQQLADDESGPASAPETTTTTAAAAAASEPRAPPVIFSLCPNSDFAFKDQLSLAELPPLTIRTPSVNHPLEFRCLSPPEDPLSTAGGGGCAFRGGDVHVLFDHVLSDAAEVDAGTATAHDVVISGVLFAEARNASIVMRDPRGLIAFEDCAWESNAGEATIVIDGTYDARAAHEAQLAAEEAAAAAAELAAQQAAWAAQAANFDPETHTSSSIDMSILGESTVWGSTTDFPDRVLSTAENGTGNDVEGWEGGGGGERFVVGTLLPEGDEEDEEGSVAAGGNGVEDGTTRTYAAAVPDADASVRRRADRDEGGSERPADEAGFLETRPSAIRYREAREEEEVQVPDVPWPGSGTAIDSGEGGEDETRRTTRSLEAAGAAPRSIVSLERCSFRGNKGNATIMVSSFSDELTLEDQDPGVLTHNDDLLNADNDGLGGAGPVDANRPPAEEAAGPAPIAHSIHLALRDTTFSSEVVDTSIVVNRGARVQATGVTFANNTAESIVRSDDRGTVALESTVFATNDVTGDAGVVVLEEGSALERNEGTCIDVSGDTRGDAGAPDAGAAAEGDGGAQGGAADARLDGATGADLRCEGVVSGGVCDSFRACDDAADATASTGASEDAPCFSDWDALVAAVRDEPPARLDFVVCPGATLVVTTPVVISHDYVTIQCGTELNPSKNCVVSGGHSHFRVASSPTGVMLARLMMTSCSGSSVMALGSAEAVLDLRECEWVNNAGASVVLIHDDETLSAEGGALDAMPMPQAEEASAAPSAMSVSVRGCTFGKNDLTFGAIANVGGTVAIYDSKFAENAGRGDVVTVRGGSVTLRGNCFDASASVAPGVVFVQRGSELVENKENFGFGVTAGAYADGKTCVDVFREADGADCLGGGAANCRGTCTKFTATECRAGKSSDADDGLLASAVDSEGGEGEGEGNAPTAAPTKGRIVVPAYNKSEESGSSNTVPIAVASVVCAFVVFGLVGIVVRRRKMSSKRLSASDDSGLEGVGGEGGGGRGLKFWKRRRSDKSDSFHDEDGAGMDFGNDEDEDVL